VIKLEGPLSEPLDHCFVGVRLVILAAWVCILVMVDADPF